MIKDTIKLLKLVKKTDSEIVQIAKGKFKIPMTIKEGMRKVKMKW